MLPQMNSDAPRHSALVRVTHWVTAISVFALLLSGIEILISHPRFYWGETGNVMMRPLFVIPIPASRATVHTGYGFVMPDQNGWSRSLHFQTAWVLVLTGLLYCAAGLLTGHIRTNLLPAAADWQWRNFLRILSQHLRLQRPDEAEAHSYNVLQRLAYLVIIFAAVPMLIWTGLAMSPAFVSAVPAAVTLLGGQQTARTLHFFLTLLLTGFVAVHIAMVILAGFRSRIRAMITGTPKQP